MSQGARSAMDASTRVARPGRMLPRVARAEPHPPAPRSPRAALSLARERFAEKRASGSRLCRVARRSRFRPRGGVRIEACDGPEMAERGTAAGQTQTVALTAEDSLAGSSDPAPDCCVRRRPAVSDQGRRSPLQGALAIRRRSIPVRRILILGPDLRIDVEGRLIGKHSSPSTISTRGPNDAPPA